MEHRRNNTFEEIWDALMEVQRVIIPLHRSPDPDSYCSAVASAIVLSEKGKEVTIISVDSLPSLPSIHSLFSVTIKDPADIDLSQYDLFLAQDIASEQRYSAKDTFQIPDQMVTINIDHHPTNTRFGALNYVDKEASSTSEILADMFRSVGVTISKEVASTLFMGLASDSGWFTFDPPAHAYDIAKYLVEAGADTRKIKTELDSNTLVNIVLTGVSHSRATYDKENKYVYSYLSHGDYKEHSVTADQIYSGVQEYKYISDVDINFSWVAQEKDSGTWTLSLRAKEAHPYDVSKIAVALGGGGHTAAAGCSVKAASIDEVKKILDNVLKSIN